MSPLWLAALLSPARVELLADDPGTWLVDEAPMAAVRPGVTALRFIEQVQPTWVLAPRWTLGVSARAQTVAYEMPLSSSFSGWAGVQTALLLPRGATTGLAWERGHLRLGAGASVLSAASWRHPSWQSWRVLPTASVAWVR